MAYIINTEQRFPELKTIYYKLFISPDHKQQLWELDEKLWHRKLSPLENKGWEVWREISLEEFNEIKENW